jgi:hypothetical protein
MGHLRAELVSRVPSRERFAGLATAWFTQAREQLFPDFDRGLKAGPSLAFDHQKDPGAPMGPPGGAHGMLRIRSQPSVFGGSWTRYSDRAWRRMLDDLASTFPYHAELMADALDERGLAASPMQSLIIGVHRLHDDPEWVRFQIRKASGDPGDPAAALPYPDSDQRRWAEFIKQWAIRADACCAYITDDPEGGGGTALEDATGQQPEDTVPRCREVLRGYSWVTVGAPQIAARLGGAAALTASGAFDEVTELPGGQVFLRATPLIQDYQDEALMHVFETLAPVLLAGRPHPMSPATELGRLIKHADAADYR